MAVEDCVNPNHIIEDCDDDNEPLVIRRRKPNQSVSGSRDSQSSLKQPNVQNPTKQSSSSRKENSIQSLKPLSSCPEESTSRNSAVSSANHHPDTKEESCYRDESEDSEDDMPIGRRLQLGSQKEFNGDAEDSDSDDDKPIVRRLPSGSVKVNSSTEKSSDDSDNDEPILSNMESSSGFSSESFDGDSDDEKPLSMRVGSNKKMPDTFLKRPSAETSYGLSSAKKVRLTEVEDDDDENIPIALWMNKGASSSKPVCTKKKMARVGSSKLKEVNKKSKKIEKKSDYSRPSKEIANSGNGQKWTTFVHNGVAFPPPYRPHGVKMLYDGKPVDLTPEQEEVATMYAVMLESDYAKKDIFNKNFFSDWKKILGKKHVINDFKKCDFTPIHDWHLREKEKKKQIKKQMSSEEKKALSEEKTKQAEKYKYAIMDGVKEKVGNFNVEPPGLFRGRGDHPKIGKLKKRIYPSDVTLNIGKGAPIPELPFPGQSWKEVRHDNTVTWLACWNDPINPKDIKHVFLGPGSTIKGQSDKNKYEKARMLKDYIDSIRATYTKNFTSKDVTKQQIAVATYLIDRLALRAGNEKEDDEADTVGCCTLKVENVKPIPPNILEFDFLGKDSIKYFKQFEAEPLVYKAIKKFREGKHGSDDLFDQLDTAKLNNHLKRLMPHLTAKVFRTFNASFTLDDMLAKGAGSREVQEKLAIYQEANKEVAIICNHQRTVPKSHSAQMERLASKINELKAELSDLEKDLAQAKKGKPPLKDNDGKQRRNLTPEAIERKIFSTKQKVEKYERNMQTKEDMKEIALGTSKINYLDPRITVAWCKRNEVPIEKIFNKSLLDKFSWAMDAEPSFRF